MGGWGGGVFFEGGGGDSTSSERGAWCLQGRASKRARAGWHGVCSDARSAWGWAPDSTKLSQPQLGGGSPAARQVKATAGYDAAPLVSQSTAKTRLFSMKC